MTALQIAETALTLLADWCAANIKLEVTEHGVEVIGWSKDLAAFRECVQEVDPTATAEWTLTGIDSEAVSRMRVAR